MSVDYPLLGSFNKYPDQDFDCEDTVNLFLIKDSDGKKAQALVSTPGLQQEVLVQPGTQPSRALFTFNNAMYGVFGSRVYRFDQSLVPNHLGNIGTNAGYVSIAANNGNQIIFVDGQAGYIYNVSTGIFSKITDADFPASPLNVAFLDTYFVIPSADSQTFQISANNDGTSWNAFNDEAQIQTYPGKLIGVGVVNERLYFFKDTSTEIWYDAGDADFPLRRDNNLIFNFGCLATASIASDYGYLFWLARDKSGAGSVMMTTGYQPTRISTPAIESLLATFDAPEDVSCYIYKEQGHIFYVMNWTTDDKTLVYDVMTNEWHRMEMIKHLPVDGEVFSSKTRHIVSCHAYFDDKHYVGSYKAPILYSMSRDYPDNAGEPIMRQRTGKHFFYKAYRALQINKFQVDLVPGIGDATGIYNDPQVYLSVSRDGGHVFGNEVPAAIGKIGERRTQAIWRKKGLARDFVPRVTIYASVAPIALLGASMDYQVLPK